nr:PepSY-like domain-containing protein [Paludibacteraceae bacterium]
VPDELLPNEISSYIKEKYPDKNIVSIERGKKTYEVKLSNGLELKFNLRGQLLEIDL